MAGSPWTTQLSVNSLNPTDLILVSQDQGGGVFSSKKITVLNFAGALPSVAQLAAANIFTAAQTIQLSGAGAALTVDNVLSSSPVARFLNNGVASLLINNITNSSYATEQSHLVSTPGTLTITGGYTTERFCLFNQPTISGAFTVTNAATVAIAGVPIAAGGATITNPLALWVQAGQTRFDGDVVFQVNAIAIAAATGNIVMVSGGQLAWSLTGGVTPASTGDTGIGRVVAGVVRPTNGAGTGAWFQNTAGRARTTTAPTNATTALSSGVLSDLTLNLIAGRKYTGRLVLIAKDSTGADGLQFDFNGGSATMTSFQATAEEAPIGATLGVSNSTALGTALTNTVVATTDTVYAINLTIVVNAGGTFIPRFAQISHSTGTATVEIGSYIWLEDTP